MNIKLNYRYLIIGFGSFLLIFTTFWIFKVPDDAEKLYYYLPEVKKVLLKDLKFKKILFDPSYNQPYNLYVSFKIDEGITDKQIIADLGLDKVKNTDTSELKRKTLNEEYKIFFFMQSLNCRRNSSLLQKEREIDWWKPMASNATKATFACFFYDDLKNCKPVSFDERHNGRVACCRYKDRFYILIESWWLK